MPYTIDQLKKIYNTLPTKPIDPKDTDTGRGGRLYVTLSY